MLQLKRGVRRDFRAACRLTLLLITLAANLLGKRAEIEMPVPLHVSAGLLGGGQQEPLLDPVLPLREHFLSQASAFLCIAAAPSLLPACPACRWKCS